MTPQVTIYTDGACSGNPGPGGWGAVLIFGEREKDICGGEAATTNNRMELTAAIEALNALTKPCRVELHTDSQYVKNGITEWLRLWKARGWKTYSKGAVKNEDLWRRLDEARLRHEVTWKWVKGHAGHPLNERADELARRGMNEARAAARAVAAAAKPKTSTSFVPPGEGRGPDRKAAHPSSGPRPSPGRTGRSKAVASATQEGKTVGGARVDSAGAPPLKPRAPGRRPPITSEGAPPPPPADREEKATSPAAPSAGRRRRRR